MRLISHHRYLILIIKLPLANIEAMRQPEPHAVLTDDEIYTKQQLIIELQQEISRIERKTLMAIKRIEPKNWLRLINCEQT